MLLYQCRDSVIIPHVFSYVAHPPTLVNRDISISPYSPSSLSLSHTHHFIFIFFFTCLSIIISLWLSTKSANTKFVRQTEIWDAFDGVFQCRLAPCGVGFDTAPSVSSAVFDVLRNADSTQQDTQMMDLQ